MNFYAADFDHACGCINELLNIVPLYGLYIYICIYIYVYIIITVLSLYYIYSDAYRADELEMRAWLLLELISIRYTVHIP